MKEYELTVGKSGVVYLGKNRCKECGITPRDGAPVSAVVWRGDQFVDVSKNLNSQTRFIIPKHKRDELGIEEGDEATFILEPDESDASIDALYN